VVGSRSACAGINDRGNLVLVEFAYLVGIIHGVRLTDNYGNRRGGEQRSAVQCQKFLQRTGVGDPQANRLARRVAHPAGNLLTLASRIKV